MSEDDHEYFKRLELVVTHLKQVGLKIRLDKCRFFKKTIKFLGHKIDENGIQKCDDKIKAVKDFPVPSNVDKVKQFLGLAGLYCCFVQEFA